MSENEFKDLVEFAKPYAARCGNIAGFARACAAEVERSGEPAFYMTTRKNPMEPGRFPIALEMWGYEESTGQNLLVATLDLDRPEYKDNPHGFMGNHLVVALIELSRSTLQSMIHDGVQVFTSQSTWSALTRGSGYAELKMQRALHRVIPETPAPARRASRL